MSRISTLALDFSSKFYFDGVALIEKGSATMLRSFIIRVLVFVTSSVLAVGAWQPASANTGDVVIARGLAAAPDSPALRDPVAAPEQGDTTVLFAGDDSETSPISAVDVPEGVLSDDSVGGFIESVDEYSTVTSLGDGLYMTELSLSPLNTLSSDGQWVPINTDVEVQSDGDVVVADNPLNPVVDDTGVGSGVLSVTASCGVGLATIGPGTAAGRIGEWLFRGVEKGINRETAVQGFEYFTRTASAGFGVPRSAYEYTNAQYDQ